MSILGNRVRRVEDPRFLTTGLTTVADLSGDDQPLLQGAACVTFVRSSIAHGRVASIDVDDARDLPGVLAVLTAADLDLPPFTPGAMTPPEMTRPLLAVDVVRFVGEPLAIVVTETPAQGEDAAEAVWADIEPLPAVVGAEAAVTDQHLLFPDAGTNTAARLEFQEPDPTLFDGCEVVVRTRVRSPRLAACPLEVRATAAAWDGGRLTVWTSTQAPHAVRARVAERYGLDESSVRVIAPDVGGGFGAKMSPYPEDLLVPFVARAVGRPVRWVETRSENMTAMSHGRDQVLLAELGGGHDGTFQAYRLTVLQDAGAYPGIGAFLPFMTQIMAQGVYEIPRVECTTRSVVTTTTPVEAFRGAGRPEATQAIERAVDAFAAEVGIDPVEVRRRNLIERDEFPYTTRTGATYDSGDYEEALDRALGAAGYESLRAEQRRRRDEGDPVQLGIGVCAYVEITAGPGRHEKEHARVEVLADGSAVVYTGSSSHGQGHATAWAMIVADRTGIPLERIEVVHGDTDAVPDGVGTFGSRSLQVGGSAVVEGTDTVIDRAKTVAAWLLGADGAEVELDTGVGAFRLAGAGPGSASVGWSEVATAAEGRGLSAAVTFTAEAPTFPFGAHVAVVEVDTETGKVELVRLVACDDAGRILNPLLAEGQRHGGIAQGVAQALLEEVRFDADGNPVTANFADYGVISAPELPSFELVAMETPTPLNALGAKGIGESGTIGATPAVHGAVLDALAPLGVGHLDPPCTPERVWRAIIEAREAQR
ncbi:MAG: xanthine dehydrogenase family protein molybdopterin-binding subunit [Acidimicrobiales bacterium]